MPTAVIFAIFGSCVHEFFHLLPACISRGRCLIGLRLFALKKLAGNTVLVVRASGTRGPLSRAARHLKLLSEDDPG
jgi:hypothetical protein